MNSKLEPEKKDALMVQVEANLMRLVRIKAKRKKISLRRVVEFYFRQFIEEQK